MRFFLTLVMTGTVAVLASGCDGAPDEPRASKAPETASAGAGATAAGSGERIELPPSPSAEKAAQEKPDHGDANDHSTPLHDAKNKRNAD